MPKVRRKTVVEAPPERVFDLVSDVIRFARLSSYIKDVSKTPDGVYEWEASLLGLRLSWEAVITENKRPVCFSWASTSGVFNRGSYTLKPAGTGTEVTFEMEFALNGLPLGELMGPALGPVISAVAGDVLRNVKKELEAP